MHFSGLMVRKSNSAAVRDCFLEGEVMNLLVNFFEGCNEGIMGKEAERRGSTVKWGNRITVKEEGMGGRGWGC